MGRLLLMRHGRTAANAERRLMGRDDPPLDDVGIGQARAAAEFLAGARLDALYSSPLARARQTAEALAPFCDLTVTITQNLAEMDFGYAAADGIRTKLHVKTTHRYDPRPGGESLFQAWGRAQRFVDEVAPLLADGQAVLGVCHYRIGQLVAGVLRGFEFNRAVDEVRVDELRNGSIHEFHCAVHAGSVLAAQPPSLLWKPPEA